VTHSLHYSDWVREDDHSMSGGWDALAAIGAATGVPSLIWQVYTWRASGPKIEVTSANGFPTYPDGHLGEHHFVVTAVNHGRAAATVTGWGLRLPDNSNMVMMNPIPLSTPLPAVVEPQTSISLYVEGGDVIKTSQQRQVRVAVLRPWVRLATGQEVFGGRLPWKG
jgi:hypothetical protein